MKRGGHSIVDLCTADGEFERRIVSKSHGKIGGYIEAKKLTWGDLWRIPKRIPNKFRKESTRSKRIW